MVRPPPVPGPVSLPPRRRQMLRVSRRLRRRRMLTVEFLRCRSCLRPQLPPPRRHRRKLPVSWRPSSCTARQLRAQPRTCPPFLRRRLILLRVPRRRPIPLRARRQKEELNVFSRFGNSARHRRLRGRLLRHRHRLLRHRHHHHHAKEDGKKRKLFFCSVKTGDVERTSRGDRSTYSPLLPQILRSIRHEAESLGTS